MAEIYIALDDRREYNLAVSDKIILRLSLVYLQSYIKFFWPILLIFNCKNFFTTVIPVELFRGVR